MAYQVVDQARIIICPLALSLSVLSAHYQTLLNSQGIKYINRFNFRMFSCKALVVFLMWSNALITPQRVLKKRLNAFDLKMKRIDENVQGVLCKGGLGE